MNELQLSKDLNVITAEIQSYKQIAGQSIFEIGRRLKGVRDNPEDYGLNGYRDWEKWCEKEVELSRTHANRFIKVAEELKPSGFLNLGIKALYEIATLPQEEREKEHTLPSGETKTVDEMTVRELQEVKRKLREAEQAKQQAEQQAEQAKKSEEIALRRLEEVEQKQPEVIEKEVIREVVPEDIQRELEHMRKMVKLTDSANKELREELDAYKLKDTADYDEKAAEMELKKLQIEADRNATQIRLAIQKLNNQIAVSRYMYEAISVSSDYEKREMRKEIDILKEIITNIEASLNNRREIN